MNTAFEALRGVKDLPSELRMASDDDPLFHQNDPMPIKGTHNERKSTRKPDVVLVSMRSASTAVGPNATWADYAFRTGTDKPQNNFGWGDILLSVEFKRINATMDKPPPKYKLDFMKSNPPCPVHSTSERGEVAEPRSGMYFD
jgi:hypothetical protein